ncbi:hypothetical protein [Streptosporangium sp. NPDC006007]|uniref:hypothetical protein n=1 Tax=Streptosporangium sp. NPDC006007 TaxID=3154575 RepID=UPI0033B7C926
MRTTIAATSHTFARPFHLLGDSHFIHSALRGIWHRTTCDRIVIEDPGEGEAIPGIHEARRMALSWDTRLRRHYWDGIKEKVYARLLENVGNVIVWWASDEPGGHPSAIVFGERELCLATWHSPGRHRVSR